MFRKDHINFEPGNCFYQPFVSMPVQGFKRSVIGSEEYRYGENHYFIASVDLPTMSYFTKATPEKPFLAINLDLDRQLIRQLVTEVPADIGLKTRSEKGLVVAETDPDILNDFLRLTELLDKPEQIPYLAPLIIREMHVRMLLGPQGTVLRAVNTLDTQSSRISEAIIWLRDNYTKPLQIDELARKAKMATSTFHRAFKQMTTLSPIQYQKRLRLYEAQRLMLVEDYDINRAAFAVGYESPNQFNREYKRLFGEPPHRDTKRLRNPR